jgi:tetratricopeptide (TPR) repeat protein
MRRALEPIRATLLAAALMSPVACGGAAHLQPPVAPGQPVQAESVPDDKLASSVHQLLLDGSNTPARASLQVGVVRKLFARAGERFDAGEPQRGLSTLTGALYLVRAGELRPEMFDAAAAHALERALEVVAPAGDEARSLAFLTMQAGALPPDSPMQGQIREHLRALQTWLRDTRTRTEVENAAADQRTYGELSMVQPGEESLSRAVTAAERWVAASMEFNADFRPGVDNPRREQLVEAYRGIRTGALVIAALYLRHGDAVRASKALQAPGLRPVTPPGLQERLDSAAHGTDPLAWRELAALYANAAQGGEDNMVVSQEIARGASWGALVEAYRRSPNAVETSVPMARMLVALGMAEAGAAVLVDTARENRNATVTAGTLAEVFKIILHEDQAHDGLSARRVFRAAAPLMLMADGLVDRSKLEPTPSQVRFAVAAIETRNGDLAAARALLEQALGEQSNVQAWSLLADIRLQAGDSEGALQALTRALSSPEAAASALARSDAHLLAFRIHRARGAAEPARQQLAQALQAALEARARSGSRPQAERMLARIAYYYGDRAAFARAIERGFEAAAGDKNAAGLMAIEASSDALLLSDLAVGRAALTRAMEANIDHDDLVYVALWVQQLELTSKQKPAAEDATLKALKSIEPGLSWTSRLAQWGLGKLADAALLSSARDTAQRTEATFYVALRKSRSGDPQAMQELRSVATSPAIQLVETHIARELTLDRSAMATGAPPTALP